MHKKGRLYDKSLARDFGQTSPTLKPVTKSVKQIQFSIPSASIGSLCFVSFTLIWPCFPYFETHWLLKWSRHLKLRNFRYKNGAKTAMLSSAITPKSSSWRHSNSTRTNFKRNRRAIDIFGACQCEPFSFPCACSTQGWKVYWMRKGPPAQSTMLFGSKW